MRKTEARAHLLIGDTYFEDRDWQAALDQYLRAQKLVKPNQAREQLQLSLRLGKTYRRLPAPERGPNPNLALAIERLASAHAAEPDDAELAIELASAHLDARQDGKAAALAERVLAAGERAGTPEQRATLLALAGKALFNGGKLDEARARFEAARQLRPADIQIRRQLVATINEQAFAAGKNAQRAQALLEQALAIDDAAPTTLTNLAVIALERGDCEAAQRRLVRLDATRGRDTVVALQLRARAHLCGAKPDTRKAVEAYAAAEREARKANDQLALAEIYAAWAPLTWDADLPGAVDKLELAAELAGQDPEIAPAARRNLALGLYRRGWKLLREGKPADAAADFERAARDASVLKGSEPFAFELSAALALIDAGRASDAARVLDALARKGNQGAYLRAPYAKAGPAFLSAYASYRGGAGGARARACADLGKLGGELGAKARELVASCWELVAHDQWRAGQTAAATRSLAAAERGATAEQKRRLVVARAALAPGRDKLRDLEALGGNPPEALVNLGIIFDLLGRPRDAYVAWTRAKARGANARDLQKWIDAKKRIYGY